MLNKLHQQLIHLVCSEEGASRADLARLTGMSKAAIGALVKEMLADGLLQESDMAASGGQGRPPSPCPWRRTLLTPSASR